MKTLFVLSGIIENMKKVAIVYDFDKTLCTKDMQEYSLIPSLGYDRPSDFWDEVTEVAVRNEMDSISAYLYLLQKKFSDAGEPLRKEFFYDKGKDIVLFNGVETWFQRINEYGRKHGFLIEHYIISSGMREIIKSTSIADEFKRIYACRYYYDESHTAVWPAQVVNYTAKTQYIFRINKQVLDVNEDAALNKYVPKNERPIPFERMIYVADGLTDVPCMRLVKDYGGKSIAVYSTSDAVAKQLKEEGRVNFICKADYSEGLEMDKVVKAIIDHMHTDDVLLGLEGK